MAFGSLARKLLSVKGRPSENSSHVGKNGSTLFLLLLYENLYYDQGEFLFCVCGPGGVNDNDFN